jgi:hypothetical protein
MRTRKMGKILTVASLSRVIQLDQCKSVSSSYHAIKIRIRTREVVVGKFFNRSRGAGKEHLKEYVRQTHVKTHVLYENHHFPRNNYFTL